MTLTSVLIPALIVIVAYIVLGGVTYLIVKERKGRFAEGIKLICGPAFLPFWVIGSIIALIAAACLLLLMFLNNKLHSIKLQPKGR